MKLKKHIKTKLSILSVGIAFLAGGVVGQTIPTPTENDFNKQVTQLENENTRIFSKDNDSKILPDNYQTQEFNKVDEFIQKHNLNHRQAVILNSMVNSNINDYQDIYFMNH